MKLTLPFITLFFIFCNFFENDTLDKSKILVYLKFENNLQDELNKTIFKLQKVEGSNELNFSSEDGIDGFYGVFNNSPYKSINSTFSPVNSHSISVWLYIEENNKVNTVVHQLEGRPHLAYSSKNGIYSITGNKMLNSTSVSINSWVHVVSVFDSETNTQKLFINGDLANEIKNAKPTPNENQFIIGAAKQLKAGQFNGKMDNFLITEEVLNKNQIKKLKEKGI